MTRTVSGHAHDANHDLHFPKRRLQHVFAKDGRALIVAMDGARNGPAKGLENPRQAVRNVVAGGADAILTTPGMAKATADQLRGRGLIIGLDAEDDTSDYGVEASLRFGADAVELKVFPGNPDDTKLADLRRTMRQVGHAPPRRTDPRQFPGHIGTYLGEHRPGFKDCRRDRV